MRSARRGQRRGDEGGNIVVLEAIVIAILLLAAVLFVLSFELPSSDSSYSREHLELVGQDTFQVLESRTIDAPAFNDRLLNKLVVEALHGDPSDLEFRFSRLLPQGTSFNLHLDNGVALLGLSVVGDAPGETASASAVFSPEWSYLHLTTDLRVYPTAADHRMRITALPVFKGQVLASTESDPVTVNLTNDLDVNLAQGTGPLHARSYDTLTADSGAGDGYPTSGDLVVNSTWSHRGREVPGTTTYEVSSATVVADAHRPAREGLENSSVTVWPRNGKLEGTLNVAWNLAEVRTRIEANGTTLKSSPAPEVIVHVMAPVQGLPGEPTTWLEEDRSRVPLLNGSTSYEVPRASLFGPYIVVVEMNYTLVDGGTEVNQSARLVDHLNVGLLSGVQPPNPVYRLSMVAWFEDWT